MSERDWTRQLLEQKERLEYYQEIAKKARKLAIIHRQGQPGTYDSRYPMDHAALVAWSTEWRACMDDLVRSLDA